MGWTGNRNSTIMKYQLEEKLEHEMGKGLGLAGLLLRVESIADLSGWFRGVGVQGSRAGGCPGSARCHFKGTKGRTLFEKYPCLAGPDIL